MTKVNKKVNEGSTIEILADPSMVCVGVLSVLSFGLHLVHCLVECIRGKYVLVHLQLMVLRVKLKSLKLESNQKLRGEESKKLILKLSRQVTPKAKVLLM